MHFLLQSMPFGQKVFTALHRRGVHFVTRDKSWKIGELNFNSIVGSNSVPAATARQRCGLFHSDSERIMDITTVVVFARLLWRLGPAVGFPLWRLDLFVILKYKCMCIK